jgi:hypothetical protein
MLRDADGVSVRFISVVFYSDPGGSGEMRGKKIKIALAKAG